MRAMSIGSRQRPPNTKAHSPPSPWCDSQNPLKDKTSPWRPTVRTISSLTAVQNSGPQWGGRWKGGPARSSNSTTVSWPPYAAAHKGVAPQPEPGGPVRCTAQKCLAQSSSEGGSDSCYTVLLPRGELNGHSRMGLPHNCGKSSGPLSNASW